MGTGWSRHGPPGVLQLLSLVQAVALLVTLYFSQRQVPAMATDLEMRVLTDIDDRFHRLGELLIEKPSLGNIIARPSNSTAGPERPTPS